MFADSITPLALQQTVAVFIQGLMGDRNAGGRGGYDTLRQSVGYFDGHRSGDNAAWSPTSAYSATLPMPGESNEDLYFYRQEHVTLKKGDRARYTVFTGKVPYEHIYQWDVPDTTNVDDRGYRPDSSKQQDAAPDQVWHALRVTNTTKHPWTTAPAFTVNGSMPVAQDTLKYTPPGGKNILKLTVATDIRAEQVQTEASRTQVSIFGSHADEVIVNGKLTIKNWKKNPIRINVNKSIVGEVKEAGQDGKVSKVVKSLASLNPTSQIEWEFSLNPGEVKELTYQYKALVRR
jgi:hypothetical protein